MATHSSVLAWRIPGTGKPGGLPSMGSHRVGDDWSNLAAAAAGVIKSIFLISESLFRNLNISNWISVWVESWLLFISAAKTHSSIISSLHYHFSPPDTYLLHDLSPEVHAELWVGVTFVWSQIHCAAYLCETHPWHLFIYKGFPSGSVGKESACNAGDLGSIPGSGRSPGEGNGNLLQYSCLENSMDEERDRLQSMELQSQTQQERSKTCFSTQGPLF